MARLPLVRASGAARESRRVRRQAQRAVVRYFRGNLQSNPRVHATVCGIPLAACHRIGLTYFAILRLAPAWYLLSLTPRFSGWQAHSQVFELLQRFEHLLHLYAPV